MEVAENIHKNDVRQVNSFPQRANDRFAGESVNQYGDRPGRYVISYLLIISHFPAQTGRWRPVVVFSSISSNLTFLEYI